MSVLRVGDLFVPGRRRWPECLQYNFSAAGHTLDLFFSAPSLAEIRAVTKGRAEVALVAHDAALMLLVRFGGYRGKPGLPWSDAPYSYWRVPEGRRIAPVEIPEGLGALLRVALVDADTGVVKGLRALGVEESFSRALHAAIERQIAAGPLDDTAVFEGWQSVSSDQLAAGATWRSVAGRP